MTEVRIISRRDLSFLIDDVLSVAALTSRPRFAEHNRATFEAVLDTAERLAASEFAPHNRRSDEAEPSWDGRVVTIIPAVKAALDAFSAAGFLAMRANAADGGAQLPETIVQAVMAMFMAANIATSAYPMLTQAAANLVANFAAPEQRAFWLKPMLEGRVFGTMALTEPQAGSSLADLRTSAEPAGDGTWRLTGSKIFISGGDHELSDNIVHMVLAKIKGTPEEPTPAGVKGISLFLVPKYLPDGKGGRGARNGVTLTGLIHKMGYRGTVSTMLSFGEERPCVGWLVGRPHQGLACMFHMMNEARIAVGLGAAMLGYAGYLHSLDYARTRQQGRPLAAKEPERPPISIIAHADVRRMLLAQKAYAEGGLALCLSAARLVDDAKTAPLDEERRRAALLLGILIPIVKAWPSDYGIAANQLAIQIHGGYGYTRDYPVEQLLRDNRLNPIHEGTNGIQAIDLLGRKIRMEGGRAFATLVAAIRETIAAAANHSALGEDRAALGRALDRAARTTAGLTGVPEADRERALANATVYLDMLGRIVVGWIWLRQGLAAAMRLDASAPPAERDFYCGKLQACRWYMRNEVPLVEHQCALLDAGDATAFEMRDAWF
ncbi:MAG TPA: acyl-CoA dehydrogenase [Stellaceae bacterium]|nr:acyl-CoA dehydrogenase [Stellaceae bacterium]